MEEREQQLFQGADQVDMTPREHDRQFLLRLRRDLQCQIAEKEAQLRVEYDAVEKRLSNKEEELDRVKKLFLEKLKEIESSFVELSQEIEEGQNLGQGTGGLAHQPIENQPTNPLHGSQGAIDRKANNELEKSIENIIGKFEEDQREEEFNNVIKANNDLLSSVTILKSSNQILEKQVAQLEEQLAKKEEEEISKNKSSQARVDEMKQSLEKLEQAHREDKEENDKLKQQLLGAQTDSHNNQLNWKQQTFELENQFQQFKLQAQTAKDRASVFEVENKTLQKQLKQESQERVKLSEEAGQLKLQVADLQQQLHAKQEEAESLI